MLRETNSLFALNDVDDVVDKLDEASLLQLPASDDAVLLRGQHRVREVLSVGKHEPPTIVGCVGAADLLHAHDLRKRVARK